MKRVAILTTFFEAESGYSLVTVAENQLRLLLAQNYDPVVLVQENFNPPSNQASLWRPAVIDLRPVVPNLQLTRGVANDFESRVQRILSALRQNLAEVEVCITHDLILQEFYKEHNVALRTYAQERPDLLWLHWIHSCPTPATGPLNYPEDCRHTPPPGYIIYPNATDQALVCQSYGLEGLEHQVKICRAAHALDPLQQWPYQDLTKSLAERADLLSAEMSAVYPTRLDRGKQPEKIIRLAAGVKQAGYEPAVLIVDWQSSGENFQSYIDELEGLAEALGVDQQVHFSSRLDDRCSQGAPRSVVMELLDLSNCYIHPSRVETYSLATHEAALRGCLLVLNHDFPAMRELFGEMGIYMDFGSDRANRVYQDEQAFWNREAHRLMTELKNNRALWAKTQARRTLTPQAQEREFERLLYLPTH